MIDSTDVVLRKLDDATPPPPPPPPPKLPPPPQIATRIFTPPLIVKDVDVKPADTPPANDDLTNVRIGDVNQAGVPDGDIQGPPAVNGVPGVVEAPKKADPDEPFVTVEIQAEYPGGLSAWARFLNKNLRYPDDALNNGVAGTVMVQFVVDLEGNVSDIQVISGPESGGLREEAIRVIRKSGKWEPAVQNGRHVKAYRKQPVTFIQGDGN
jgi:protein TonB